MDVPGAVQGILTHKVHPGLGYLLGRKNLTSGKGQEAPGSQPGEGDRIPHDISGDSMTLGAVFGGRSLKGQKSVQGLASGVEG
jgi:hypothetical protein